MGYLAYSTNNSGGSWWLQDRDWEALDRAGWVVHWIHDWNDPSHTHSEDITSEWARDNHSHGYMDELVAVKPSGERWLGALAKSAAVTVGPDGVYADADAAVHAFELLTNSTASDEGCNCCGPPHSFTYVDDEGNDHYWYSEVVETRSYWS